MAMGVWRQGDWRGISRHYVLSRNPTQVASHAQKYFIRQSNLNKRKRRSSLFDIVSDVVRALRSRVRHPTIRCCRPASWLDGLLHEAQALSRGGCVCTTDRGQHLDKLVIYHMRCTRELTRAPRASRPRVLAAAARKLPAPNPTCPVPAPR